MRTPFVVHQNAEIPRDRPEAESLDAVPVVQDVGPKVADGGVWSFGEGRLGR